MKGPTIIECRLKRDAHEKFRMKCANAKESLDQASTQNLQGRWEAQDTRGRRRCHARRV